MNASKSTLSRSLTILSYVLAVLIVAPGVIGTIANDATPLGVPADWFIVLGVAVAMTTVLLNQVIAAIQIWVSGHNTGVSWGLSSYVGYGITILTGFATGLDQLDSASAPLNVDPKVWATLAAVTALLTTLGRGVQHLADARNSYNPYIPGGLVQAPDIVLPSSLTTLTPVPSSPTTTTQPDQGTAPSPGTDG